MTRQTLAAALLAITAGLSANAEQFAVHLDGPYQGASAALAANLKISIIDSFTDDGANYLILDAPSGAYVEAFLYALGRSAVELNRLEANWTAPAFASLPLAKRLEFLQPIECEFCSI